MPDYEQRGGNPFYNPYQSGPDWGAGIRDVLNQMWSYKELRRKEDEDKRRWEAQYGLQKQQAEADAEYRRGMAEYYKGGGRQTVGVPMPQTPLDREGIKTFLRTTGMPDGLINATDGLPDEEVLRIIQNISKKFGQEPKQPSPVKPVKDPEAEAMAQQIKADRTLLSQSSTTIGKIKTQIFTNSNMKPDQKKSAIDGLNMALGKIGQYQSILGPNRPLPQGIRETIMAMAADPTALMTGDLVSILGAAGADTSQTPPVQSLPTSLPPEVQAYIQNHPGVDIRMVLQKYQEWIKKRGNQ